MTEKASEEKTIKVNFGSIDGGNLAIEVYGRSRPDSPAPESRNYIQSKITVSLDQLKIEACRKLYTPDFHRFLPEVERLFKKLKGTAIFQCDSDRLRMKLSVDSRGHIFLKGILTYWMNSDHCEIPFKITFDQTYLKSTLHDLRELCAKYPVVK